MNNVNIKEGVSSSLTTKYPQDRVWT